MVTVRRWYLLLVCVVALQAGVWATISLLQTLLDAEARGRVEDLALPAAVIVVSLPLFLLHWIPWERQAVADEDERASPVRRFYFYLVLSLFLIPAVGTAFEIAERLFDWLLGGAGTPSAGQIRSSLVTLLILGAAGALHLRLLGVEQRSATDAAGLHVESDHLLASLRRLFVLLFAGVGLGMGVGGEIALLTWLFDWVGGVPVLEESLVVPLALLVVGLPLWGLFWRRVQRDRAAGGLEESAALSRLFYLHAVIFLAVAGGLLAGTYLLDGLFRRLLALPPDREVSGALATLVVAVGVWLYHSRVLEPGPSEGAAVTRSAVRRLYLYLVAALGLALFLSGVAGLVSVLIRTVAQGPGEPLRESLAFFAALLVTGFPVWFVPWRRLQRALGTGDLQAGAAHRSLIRKLYLYFYLFLASMTILGGAIYVVFQGFSVLLGERSAADMSSDLSQALAFTAIAAGVWGYHFTLLRTDGRWEAEQRRHRLAGMRVAVIDPSDGVLGRAVVAHLARRLPGLDVQPLPLTVTAAAVMELPEVDPPSLAILETADLVIAPASLGAGDAGPRQREAAARVAAVPARRLLVPVPQSGWEWVGLEDGRIEALAKQSAEAVRRIVEEEEDGGRPLGVGTVVLLLVGGMLALCVIVNLLSVVFPLF